jgi:hypothetical protein
MVTMTQLWAPILLSGFLVFFASSLVHMVLKWHNTDYKKLPDEDEIRAAIRKANPAPGQYVTPWCMDQKDMKSPEVQKKYADGPVGVFYMMKPGPVVMGPTLMKWLVFCLVVSTFVACVATQGLPVGAEYMTVFQFVALVTFLAYSAGDVPAAIWLGKPWLVVLKDLADGLIYGLVTAGAFGWLWPR